MKYKHILYLDNSETIYTRAIRDELSRISDEIDCFFYDEILIKSIYFQKFRTKEAELLQNVRIKEFLNFISRRNYDLILVKEPQLMPISFFEGLRKAFGSVPILNYNWSSIKKYNILPYTEFFTTIVTFDYADSDNYRFKYLPLFYLKEFEGLAQNESPKRFALSFIGSGFSEGRIPFLNRLIQVQENQRKEFYLYIYTTGRLNNLKLILNNKRIAKYSYSKPLHFNGLQNIISQTDATIDHPMSIQTGLTIRTFEALASGLHLYTTNKNIIKETFYSNEKITIINEDLSDFNLRSNSGPKFDRDFSASFQEYRIDNWIKRLLGTLD